MGDQEEVDYRQELGLKKILYKYENQNQQLRSQIKALNQRLEWILNKPKTPQTKKILNPIEQYQGRLLKQQMQRLYKQINNNSIQMKINKEGIDERHIQKCTQIENRIIKEQKELKELNYKLFKYEQLDEGLKGGNMMGTLQRGNMAGQKVDAINNSRVNTDNLNNLVSNNNNTINSNSININKAISNNLNIQFLTNNKTLRSGTVRVQNYLQKLSSIKDQTQTIRKSIKELQHQRDNNQRQLIKKHLTQNQVKTQNRLLEQEQSSNMNNNMNNNTNNNNNNNNIKNQSIPPQQNPNSNKKTIFSMQNTQENYSYIKEQLEKLKKQKYTTLENIKNQNLLLSNKLKQLENQLNTLNNSIDIPPIPYQKKSLKIPIDLSISSKIQSPFSISNKLQSPLLQKKSLKPIEALGQTEFQRKNDKNFVPKTSRRVQWQSTKNTSGIPWNFSQSKSPIIGMNLWFDGHLLGLQVLHQSGSSGQQLQVLGGKKLIPIQYRLSTGDHLENIIIYISDGFIHGMQFLSKNGRADKFGNISKARKFDFGIKKPQKPIVSFGQYKITNNVSEITKLGFQVI